MAQDQAYESGIDWIDAHASLRAVCAPLDDKGQDLDDNLVFEEIEGEMMKRGTLAHSTIRWDFIWEQTVILLREEAKDLRLILFMIHTLPHLPPTPSLPTSLPLACHLFTAFLQQWNDVATPTGKARSRILARLVDGLDMLVKKAEENGLEAHYRPSICQALEQSHKILSNEAVELAEKLLAFARRIEKIIEESPNEPPVPRAAGTESKRTMAGEEKTSHAPTTSQARAPSPSDLVLDGANERALRESLAKMADFLFDMDHGQPLSYRLRRYACWYGLREQPALKKDAATIIMPPSEESVDLYRQAVIQEQTEIDIIKRLERSCYLQPFWIEGHYLAWQLARSRGAMLVASAIFEEVSQFVKSAPWLYKLQFSSQLPFIPAEVANWLESHKTSSPIVTKAPEEGENHPIRQARRLAEAGDMAAACALLEVHTDAFDDLRSRTEWELSILELLGEWGMKTHAALTASRLEEMIKNVSVAEWDGAILERLRHLKSAIA